MLRSAGRGGGGAQMKIRRMLVACWILKATNTQSQYVTFIAFHRKNGCTNAPQNTLHGRRRLVQTSVKLVACFFLL